MQVEGHLIHQPLGRHHAFDRESLRRFCELRLRLGVERLKRVDDHRQFMRPESLGERGETQREGHRPDGRSNHEAIDGSGGHFGHRFGCRGDDMDVNVLFTQRIGNLRRRCVDFGHHDEPLSRSRKHSLDLRKHFFERLSSLDRLGEYSHSAHRQRASAVLVGGNYVYGNVAELDICLESS